MQKLIDRQNMKITDLEKRPQSTQISAPAPATTSEPTPPMSDYEFNERLSNALGGSNKWLKDLKFGGDIRLRYEAFHHGSGSRSETDDRNRFRFRLRYGFEKKFSDEVKAGFSMASGERAAGSTYNGTSALSGDPTSTNTTMDNLFNWKDIFIEKVYGSYSPNWAKLGPIENLEVTGGKFTNPFEKGSSDMVWDRDVKPEGAYEKIDLKLFERRDFKLKAYAVAGQFILDEDAAATNRSDAELFAYQVGLNPVFYTPILERPVELLSAFSLYDYSNYSVNNNFKINGGTSLARGNSVCSSSELCTPFQIYETYNELSFYPYGIPIRPFYDLAHNAKSGRSMFDKTAWSYGVKVGKLIKKGDWETSFAYKYLGRDAVTGFNDSDFTGATTTHTGTRGFVAKLAYLLTDNISLNGAAFFLENLNHDSVIDFTGTTAIRDEQQRRFQVDMSWKF